MAVQAVEIASEVCGADHPHEALVEAMVLMDDERARRLAGRLRGCTKALPLSCSLWLRFAPGSTYAEAARRVLKRASWASLSVS